MLIIAASLLIGFLDLMFHLLRRAVNSLLDLALYSRSQIRIDKNMDRFLQHLVSTAPYNDTRAFCRQVPDYFTLPKINLIRNGLLIKWEQICIL